MMLSVPDKPPLRQHWYIEPILPTPTSPLVKIDGARHDGLRGKDMSKVKQGRVKLPPGAACHVDPGIPGLTGLVRGNIEIPNGFQPLPHGGDDRQTGFTTGLGYPFLRHAA